MSGGDVVARGSNKALDRSAVCKFQMIHND
jgi:hypothetical protein